MQTINRDARVSHLTEFGGWPLFNRPSRIALHDFQMESCAMSDQQLRFKGPGFDFDAKGWMGIGAAILIIVLVVVLPRLWH